MDSGRSFYRCTGSSGMFVYSFTYLTIQGGVTRLTIQGGVTRLTVGGSTATCEAVPAPRDDVTAPHRGFLLLQVRHRVCCPNCRDMLALKRLATSSFQTSSSSSWSANSVAMDSAIATPDTDDPRRSPYREYRGFRSGRRILCKCQPPGTRFWRFGPTLSPYRTSC